MLNKMHINYHVPYTEVRYKYWLYLPAANLNIS